MSVTQNVISGVAALAKQVEGDIISRGLRAGDRYRTAAETGLMLGVSAATAHRAMTLLVREGLLRREQGRGTFVGHAIGGRGSRTRVRVVHVLLAEDQKDITSVQLEDLISAIRGRIENSSVQFCFLPEDKAVDYAREVIGASQSSGQFAGAVPISCSREVYRYLSEVGGPVVVLGSLYPDQRHLTSVDMDYRQAGALMARYLIERKHQRMALLSTGGGRPGDHALYDGISDAFTRAGLPHNSLVVRLFPHDFGTFRAQIRELLSQENHPTGILCGSDRLVSIISATASELGLRLPGDLDLVFQGQTKPEIQRLPYPRVQPKLSFREIAHLIADRLALLADGQSLDEKQVIIPVELHDPE